VTERAAAELELAPAGTGTRLRLRVRAGAARDAIVGAHGGALKLSVRTAPERGRANRAVLHLLAERLGVPTSELRIVAGTTSPDKVVVVPLAPHELRRRLG
jgi:uncharacterized protein (TIGR00251 family)